MYYNPWIAENYRSGTGKFGQLLVLATLKIKRINVHPNYIPNTICQMINGNVVSGHHTLIRIGRVANPEDYTELYRNCAFYFLPETNSDTEKHLKGYREAFFSLLSTLHPDKLFVVSENGRILLNRLYPDTAFSPVIGRKIEAEGKVGYLRNFQYGLKSCESLFIPLADTSNVFALNPLVKVFLENHTSTLST